MQCFKACILISILIFISITNQFAQSISLTGGYTYYFLRLEKYGDLIDIKNNRNYEGGILVSKYFSSRKIETGFLYGQKEYTFSYQNPLPLLREKSLINYWFVPLMINQKIIQKGGNIFSIIGGTYFLIPFRYSKEIKLESDTLINRKSIPVEFKFGNKARLGIKYSRKLIKQFILNIESFAEYKFNREYYSQPLKSPYENLTEDRFSIGINFGIEWIWTKKELTYYTQK